MKVNGINWLVTCTPGFDEMDALCRDVLDLSLMSEGKSVTDTRFTRYVQFKMPGGSVVEMLDGDASARRLFVAPIAQSRLDDVVAARREMEQKGIAFLGDTYHSEGEGWACFRAPDGHLYPIGRPYIEPA